MKIMGFATDVAPPADFVLQSRPKGDLDYIPVFQPPPEPAKPALERQGADRRSKGDLDSVEKRDDALRQAFPPAAKAVGRRRPRPRRRREAAGREAVGMRFAARPARC